MKMLTIPAEVRGRILFGHDYEKRLDLKTIDELTDAELEAIPLNNLHKIPGVAIANTTIKDRVYKRKWNRRVACTKPSIRSKSYATRKRKESKN